MLPYPVREDMVGVKFLNFKFMRILKFLGLTILSAMASVVTGKLSEKAFDSLR